MLAKVVAPLEHEKMGTSPPIHVDTATNVDTTVTPILNGVDTHYHGITPRDCCENYTRHRVTTRPQK